MSARKEKMSGLQRRKVRVRKAVSGTSERPRLNVYRSNKHIYAQIIDDTQSKTLAAASTKTGDNAGNIKKTDAAKKVGVLIGKKAIENGITKVVFDRGGNIYHGRVKAVAEGAREAGLKF
jgi:large subunit ribosomal protein L18